MKKICMFLAVMIFLTSGISIVSSQEFSVETYISEHIFYPGETRMYSIDIFSEVQRNITVDFLTKGDIQNFTILPSSLEVPARSSRSIDVYLKIPEDIQYDTYLGFIEVSGERQTIKIPVTIEVRKKEELLISLNIKVLTPTVSPRDTPKLQVIIQNLGIAQEIRTNITYIVKKLQTGEVVKNETENINIITSPLSFIRPISINEYENLTQEDYIVHAIVEYGAESIQDVEKFQVLETYWADLLTRVVTVFVVILIVSSAVIYQWRWYKRQKKKKARFIFPVSYNKLPKTGFPIGKVAETRVGAFIDTKDLLTHTIVAGATGSGKSVTASLIVEEALKKKIPAVIFDPTAQWSGFVRPCRDKYALDRYKEFKLDSTKDPRSFKGMVLEITDPRMKIDLKKYMKPGEVTVFVLRGLKPGDYDEAVTNIIRSIFFQKWEEATELKLLVVFDEVHRLLEKYGGKGGYMALEKACREFRKWGIGLVLCSQILGDFKEAVAGNILMEIQMSTKSMDDLERIRKKYGEEYVSRVTREGVGTGMIQNPRYNDGRPYFVEFKPPLHSPHKITDNEMEVYKRFSKELEDIEKKIESMKARKKDVSDFELELRLAKDKLKEGKFKMAEIYIYSLKKNI